MGFPVSRANKTKNTGFTIQSNKSAFVMSKKPLFSHTSILVFNFLMWSKYSQTLLQNLITYIISYGCYKIHINRYIFE